MQIYHLTVCRLEFQHESQWAKSKVLAVLCSSLEVLGESLFLCFFQLLEVVCIPWPMPPFSIFKAKDITSL